jgi:hypothetical protein
LIKSKRQRFKEGSLVRIELTKARMVYGRLLPGNHVCIYDGTFVNEINFPPIQSLKEGKILFYARIFKDIISNGHFQIVGYEELTQSEIDDMPPHFYQDLFDIDNCMIYFQNGIERKVKPEECVGLEGPVVWEAEALIGRIEDFYAGRKNPYVELDKVILSTDDPRYQNPNIRWNFEKEKFEST